MSCHARLASDSNPNNCAGHAYWGDNEESVMRKLVLFVVAALAIMFVALALNTSGAHGCAGGWACGESVIIVSGGGNVQLCINSHLLSIKPSSPSNIYLHVPKDAVIQIDPKLCGGDAKAMITDDEVNRDDRTQIMVGALTEPDAPIDFVYGDDSVTAASPSGRVKVNFKAKK